ncbi:MAG: WYL domain-containing protein [Marinifilaceae bacterium]
MSKKDSFKRYSIIINTLRKHDMDYKSLMEYFKKEEDIYGYKYCVSQRTLRRDIDEISSIFDIEINYDRSRKVYSINTEENSLADERLYEALDTMNALSINNNAREYIHFEKRRPQGTENLYGLIHAVKNKKMIHFKYLKYGQINSTARYIEPLALKEFRNRWYIVGNEKDSVVVKTFCLDRLTELEISSKSFKPLEKFNLKSFFTNVYGVTNAHNKTPDDVILSFEPIEGKYIKDLPLHETQEILVDNEQEVRVKLNIYPTYEFMMEILSMGANVTVLEPESFKTQITDMLKRTINNYN